MRMISKEDVISEIERVLDENPVVNRETLESIRDFIQDLPDSGSLTDEQIGTAADNYALSTDHESHHDRILRKEGFIEGVGWALGREA